MLATTVSQYQFQYRTTDTGFYTFLHHLPPVGGEVSPTMADVMTR